MKNLLIKVMAMMVMLVAFNVNAAHEHHEYKTAESAAVHQMVEDDAEYCENMHKKHHHKSEANHHDCEHCEMCDEDCNCGDDCNCESNCDCSQHSKLKHDCDKCEQCTDDCNCGEDCDCKENCDCDEHKNMIHHKHEKSCKEKH